MPFRPELGQNGSRTTVDCQTKMTWMTQPTNDKLLSIVIMMLFTRFCTTVFAWLRNQVATPLILSGTCPGNYPLPVSLLQLAVFWSMFTLIGVPTRTAITLAGTILWFSTFGTWFHNVKHDVKLRETQDGSQ